jgi:hypothetical protein
MSDHWSPSHFAFGGGPGTRFHQGAPGCSYFAVVFAAGRAGLRAALVFLAAAAVFLTFPLAFAFVTTNFPPRNARAFPVAKL